MKMKKLFGIILIIAMTMSFLYGCGAAPAEQAEEDVGLSAAETVAEREQMTEGEPKGEAEDEDEEPQGEAQTGETDTAPDGGAESANAPGVISTPQPKEPETVTEAEKPASPVSASPAPVEPENMAVTDKVLTCTISVSCEVLLSRMDLLNPEKAELVPANGWILEPIEVEFYEGESVFNVLQRTLKQYKIHMEFVNTPIYNSAYIEGIGNLYEFDAGELSGWMYAVNGWYPNYGCSRYILQDGDVITWRYTTDLGADVGGHFLSRDEA